MSVTLIEEKLLKFKEAVDAACCIFYLHYPSARVQATALEMIHTLRVAFSELLEENEWMDDETRAVARDKANAMNEKIGYPDMLTDPVELAEEYENVSS